MSQTLNEIQQGILNKVADSSELSALEVLTDDEKASLSNLTSTSKVSVWRLFVWIIAYAIFLFQQIMDIFRVEIDIKVKANRPHTVDWYKTKALAFQYGDTLVDSDEYSIIDATKQIVKQVAIVEGDRKIVAKIATLQGDELVKLSDINQVNAFATYMDKVKDAGTLLQVVNEDADKLKVDLDFYYDALIVRNDGTTITTNINVVETAIKSYLKSLDFNGEFTLMKMDDYLQNATGYKDLKINFVGFKAGIATSYTNIARNYQPLSGYMKLEELTVNYYPVV